MIDLDSRSSHFRRLVKGPKGFRQLLQRLGPTFIKIGQFLALRPDLVSQEYCEELLLLLDQLPPFSWEEAKTILRKELGGEPTEILLSVDPIPVAAGSLAQTHLARLQDGTEVALKIQRPGIQKRILRDLGRARLLARLLEASGVALIASPREVVQEVTEWMLRELDFHYALENMARLHHRASGSAFERMPRPYPELSTARVLTAEYLRGVPVSALLLTLRSGSLEEMAWVNELDIDYDQLAANLFTACLTQMFRYQFFHVALHPDNLMVLPGNVIGFVDFGLCDDLDETVRQRQIRYLSAVYSGKDDLMFKAFTDMLIPSEQTDIEVFRREFLVETSAWLSRREANRRHPAARSLSEEASPTRRRMLQLIRLARRHKLQIPRRIVSMHRTLLTAESVADQLGKQLDLGAVGRQFFTTLQTEEALRVLNPKEIKPILLSLLTLLSDSPNQLQQLLSDLSDGRFVLNTIVTEAPKVARTRNRRIRFLATSILSVGIAVLLTRAELPELFGVTLAWPLGIVLMLLYIWIFIQWRRL